MNKDSEMKNNFVLSMRQIASWQIDAPDIVHELAPIQARVPSLQRGAVWEPQQIEMLWDSIFRGFPIGAIVVSEKIKDQLDRKSITQAENDVFQDRDDKTTHHILDGQQRCNAITWGFVDPFQKRMRDDTILWLDLKPGKLLNNTTRKYLFRITTKAHPWGFGHGDEAKILGVAQRDSFVDKLAELYKSKDLPEIFCADEVQKNLEVKTRPTPKFAFPAEAGCPVPVFLLLKHFIDGKLNLNELAQEPWIKVIEVWSGISIKNEEYIEIEDGLKMAEQARLITLSVPNGLESIENVEQIFQRLNRQGTPLDNEELVYSMMKAYWPAIEDVISKIENPPITEARLVNLGIRIALTGNGSEKLASELTVTRIREIFSKTGDKTVDDIKDRESIESYFQKNGELGKALKWINDYLLYKKYDCTYGLPAYLRSSIAWSSREVFAWLMLLAKRDKYREPLINYRKKIIGLALSIHWFGLEKEKAVNKLIGKTDLSNVTVVDINEGSEKKLVLAPLNVPKLNAALQLDENSGDVQLSKWISFWQGVVVRKTDGAPRSEDDANKAKEEYGLFIEKLRNQNEFLVYEQRADIEKVFEGFDPSNKLMWKGHNRPWDYDHILPSNKLNGQGRSLKKYTPICQAWQQSIGNLIAVDFTFNRSAQDKKTASEKYASDEYIKDGFFDIELEDTEDIDKAKKFVLAAKSRLIKTYKEWLDCLKIDQGEMP
ncbi:DUF262 domain-containing protein [Ferrovum myxofaciens]|uniref:DUF262 domain-containing protein n=1 Tax=Ferrovum myxofaciens TaxID=416213 RepID=A0A9E6MZ18_9PROT|nr:DUF262 domain-containing protein [Ferrovum myxofaciens]QKE37664.1 MAG: DUF262 domain-containing protein [Ferrovum myxofaciens]QWY75323.1 MAG: DUF262 domain-containing protein [Ferrovum myxofaciens]QWY78063.1 MAG: DUF262 domain-containing protein [Ferrovum myxofaciens]